MKKILYWAVLLLLAVSCAKDDSTMVFPSQNPDFSKITLNLPIKTSFVVKFGQELVVVPQVEQTRPEKALSYLWTAVKVGKDNNALGLRFECGKEVILKYVFPEMGNYMIRLEVRNEDYGELIERVVEVKQVEQGGYFAVGTGEDGLSSIAFCPLLSEEEINAGVQLAFIPDMIRTVNPDFELKNVVRFITSRVGWSDDAPVNLFIFCEDKICVADPKSFRILQQTFLEPRFGKIVAVQAEDETTQKARIYTDQGRCLLYHKLMYMIEENPKDMNIYDKIYPCFTANGYSNMSYFVGVNYGQSKVYCWNINFDEVWNNTTKRGTGYYDKPLDNVRKNIFLGRKIISACRMNGSSDYDSYYIVSVAENDPNAVEIIQGGDYVKEEGYGFFPLNNTPYKYTVTSPLTLPQDAEIIANRRYRVMYYANQNGIYIWDMNKPTLKLPTDPALRLDEAKEITALKLSFDMKELYVGFYDREHSGEMKGGMYVYDALEIANNPSVQPRLKFEGITYRPTEVGFKPRANENGIYKY